MRRYRTVKLRDFAGLQQINEFYIKSYMGTVFNFRRVKKRKQQQQLAAV